MVKQNLHILLYVSAVFIVICLYLLEIKPTSVRTPLITRAMAIQIRVKHNDKRRRAKKYTPAKFTACINPLYALGVANETSTITPFTRANRIITPGTAGSAFLMSAPLSFICNASTHKQKYYGVKSLFKGREDSYKAILHNLKGAGKDIERIPILHKGNSL